jgi:REP element-mobilizing transposase RayT
MSHSRLIYHIIFATKDRFPLTSHTWEKQLYACLARIVKKNKGRVIIVNGMADHVYLLIVLEPCDLPTFMRELKAASSRWAKQHNSKFAWQRRYETFTVSESTVEKVRDYIRDQKILHERRTIEQGYVGILRNHNVEFNEKYLWD